MGYAGTEVRLATWGKPVVHVSDIPELEVVGHVTTNVALPIDQQELIQVVSGVAILVEIVPDADKGLGL